MKKQRLIDLGKCLHNMSQPMQVLLASTSIMEALIREHGMDDDSITRINQSANDLADKYQECVLMLKDLVEELDVEIKELKEKKDDTGQNRK